MGNTIQHRGPDHTGYYFDERAGFVHNRLSLVDVSSNGHQPFVDERHVLLFNGEIYNHRELRKKHLPDKGFISSSDTETLFHLLSQFGPLKTAKMIKGMFAFVWYDRISGETYLVRDRFGIKPLFYMHWRGQLVFGSEIKALALHFKIQADRLLVMSSTLGELEYSRHLTAYSEVRQLEPGSILRYSGGSDAVIQRFFRLTDLVDKDYHRELHGFTEEGIVEEFGRLLGDSVESMLMSDVGMGAFVSGGIDSSIITSIASRHQPISMYTANVIGRYSELDACRKVSSHIGQPLHVYDYEPGHFITDLVKTTWHYECPITVHGNAMPFNGVARLARSSGTKAVLTGEGSDELFLGYPRLLTRKLDGLLKMPYNVFDRVYSTVPGLTKYLNLKKHNYSNDLLYLPFVGDRKGDIVEYMDSYSFVRDRKTAQDHALTLEMLGRGLHSLLWRNDRVGMMHSIESRFPFLDEDLVRFAANIPIGMKIGRTSKVHNIKHPFRIDKKVVRMLAKRYVPTGIEKIEKKGFIIFGLGSLELSKGFFNNGFVSEFLKLGQREIAHMEGGLDRYLLAKLAQVEIWGRMFVRQEDVTDVENWVSSRMTMKGTS